MPLCIARLNKLSRNDDLQAKLQQTDWDLIVCDEAHIYSAVTEYVWEEFNRADALSNNGRKGTVGFALTILQRRLASSPEAIYQSLKRRQERLRKRLKEEELVKRGQKVELDWQNLLGVKEEDWEDFEDDLLNDEREATEEELVDRATAAHTIAELKVEIELLQKLEKIALQIKLSGTDRKWEELSRILQNEAELFDVRGHRRKLVIFTEHRDTLNYLADRIRFDKELISVSGKPLAAFVCPGNPILDATIDLVLERHEEH